MLPQLHYKAFSISKVDTEYSSDFSLEVLLCWSWS